VSRSSSRVPRAGRDASVSIREFGYRGSRAPCMPRRRGGFSGFGTARSRRGTPGTQRRARRVALGPAPRAVAGTTSVLRSVLRTDAAPPRPALVTHDETRRLANCRHNRRA
jgi:hypothetical protein